MNLANILGDQPQAHLRGLAQKHGLAGGADLPAALAAHLKQPATLRGILDDLNEAERAALKVITFARGGDGIVMEQCHQRINQVTGRRRRNGAQVVAGLMGRGLVYVRRAKYRQHYFIPTDLRAELDALFGQDIHQRVAVDAATEVQPRSHDPYAVLRWICQFLAHLHKEGGVEVTQAGAIYRRAQRHLLRLMGRDELDGPRAEARDHVATGLHPDPLDFVFEYCRSRNLCEIKGATLVPTELAAAWVARGEWERRRDLLDFWREARLSWDVDVKAVLSVLLSLPTETWADLGALFREVEPMASDLFRGGRRRPEHKVVRYLRLQGLLAIGEAAADPVCRLTAIGRALLEDQPEPGGDEPEDSFIVQSTFGLYVPAHIDTKVLWRIEEIADLEKTDQMMVYRISRQTVYRALRLGCDREGITGFLRRHARNELPQNVAFSVQDWASAFGRIKFANALTLQVDDAHLADELMASRAVKPYVLGRLAPTVLIVDRDKYTDLIAVLEAEGHMPSPGIVEMGDINPWGEPWQEVGLTAAGPAVRGGAAAKPAKGSRGRNKRRPDPPKSAEQ